MRTWRIQEVTQQKMITIIYKSLGKKRIIYSLKKPSLTFPLSPALSLSPSPHPHFLRRTFSIIVPFFLSLSLPLLFQKPHTCKKCQTLLLSFLRLFLYLVPKVLFINHLKNSILVLRKKEKKGFAIRK